MTNIFKTILLLPFSIMMACAFVESVSSDMETYDNDNTLLTVDKTHDNVTYIRRS